MKEKKYVVGVDLGTTSTKTVIFDFEGNVVGAGQVENPLYYPAPGRQECDGDELIHVILDATRLAVKDADIDTEQIAGISVDCFRCTIALRDKDGGFTMPIIIWQDLRSSEMIPEIKKMLEEKYGKSGAKERIFATTDKSRGALKTLATGEGYETFVVPDDVGGRFSVLSAVGLLPIAAAGISIDDLMAGAAQGREASKAPFEENDIYKYAVIRNILHKKGKDIEMLINYEPRLHFVAEWWKQLFGESEGKDNKGIFPASADFSTDLHSLGQFIQDGKRNLFETLVNIETVEDKIVIEADEADLDGLNFLAGKELDYVNKMAAAGTILAHTDGGVPNLVINMPKADAFYLGYLFYFFEKACAVSGYLLGINPFDQPGVEAYKKNMFALLEKPGFEKETEILKKRLNK